ncbi:MAG: uncharacterized protein JWN70_5849 [Planctomycetaceae bacterium]|nr:uncharacterized protein [Planctomycetaceae bacterium]
MYFRAKAAYWKLRLFEFPLNFPGLRNGRYEMSAPENYLDDAGLPLLPAIGVIVVVGFCCAFGLLLAHTVTRNSLVKRNVPSVPSPAPELSERLQESVAHVSRSGPSGMISSIEFNSSATDQDLAEVTKVPSVSHIYLYSPHVTNVGLRSLKKLPAFTGLTFPGRTGVSDADFKVLGEFKKLTWLDLDGSLFGDEGLAALNGLPHLSMLQLEQTRITDLGLLQVESLPELVTLCLDRTRVGQVGSNSEDFGFARLAGFPKLMFLSLIETQIQDDCLAELPKCLALRSINLSGVALTPEGCRSLAQCPALTSLTLSSDSIGGAHLVELAQSPLLQDLHIEKSSIAADDLIQLKQLRHLKVCRVQSSRASREDIHATIRKHMPGVVVEFVCGTPGKCGTPDRNMWTWLTGN